MEGFWEVDRLWVVWDWWQACAWWVRVVREELDSFGKCFGV